MTKYALIETLVSQLILIDKGMEVFDTPLPDQVVKGLIDAVAGFGSDAIPYLHTAIESTKGKQSLDNTVIALGEIGDASSIPILIDLHRNFSNFMMGVIIVQALARSNTDAALQYLADTVTQRANGNRSVVNSGVEITFACEALGNWHDQRGQIALKRALDISGPDGMPQAAIAALAKHEDGRAFLRTVAEQRSDLRDAIITAIRIQDDKTNT